jgi:TfoX/Sxy family transcriptional regulator of competence genes
MKFTKTPKELFDVIALLVKDFKCEGKKMFGGAAYFVNRNMFTGVHQSTILLRLSDTDREKILKKYDGITIFEPLPGRKMKEYVAIPESIYSDPGEIRYWMMKSYEYASKLPPKGVKKRDRK